MRRKMWFNVTEYQNQIIKDIEDRLNKNQKLYLEIVGNCIDQSDFSRIAPELPSDIWKRHFHILNMI